MLVVHPVQQVQAPAVVLVLQVVVPALQVQAVVVHAQVLVRQVPVAVGL